MTQRKQFIEFSKRVFLFGSPFLLLALSYFVFDPFHVLRNYDSYPDNYLEAYNRNRISTQIFLNNNPKYNFKSFVFGSSRSSVFFTQDWGKYIGDSNAYHFDASNECISGIANKISFIDKQQNKIENALIIFDGETFNYAIDTSSSIIHIQDYKWSGQSKFAYNLLFFKAYFKDLFFLKYFDTKLFHTYRPYMYGVFSKMHMIYTPINNNFIFKEYNDELVKDSTAYYSRDLFYKRDTLAKLEEPQSIKPYQHKFLKQIKDVLSKNKTNYQIVIAPTYSLKKFNKEDLEVLKQYFEPTRIHDYSGKNNLSLPLSNFYEIYHFKPSVARIIMKDIYEKSPE